MLWKIVRYFTYCGSIYGLLFQKTLFPKANHENFICYFIRLYISFIRLYIRISKLEYTLYKKMFPEKHFWKKDKLKMDKFPVSFLLKQFNNKTVIEKSLRSYLVND